MRKGLHREYPSFKDRFIGINIIGNGLRVDRHRRQAIGLDDIHADAAAKNSGARRQLIGGCALPGGG